MDNFLKLETEKLILRDIGKGDETAITKYANSLNISQFTQLIPYPYTKEDANWFVNHCIIEQQKTPRTSYELAITLKPNDELIGVMGLTRIDLFSEVGTIGYWLAEDFWRQGITTQAAKKIIEFGFNELKLRRINIQAYTLNLPSNNLIKKLGFTFEGIERMGHRVKATGKIFDSNRYGMLKEEWLKLSKNY